MSDINFDTDDDIDIDDNDEQDQGKAKVTLDRDTVRRLEKQAGEAKKLQTVARENFLLKAGVDTDSPVGKLLLTHPELDISKPDEAKALLESLGAIKASEDVPPEVDVPAGEQTQTDERQRLATGATAEGIVEEDPYQSAVRRQREVLRSGTEIDGLAEAVATIRSAGAKGDARVLHDPRNPRQHYSPVSPS